MCRLGSEGSDDVLGQQMVLFFDIPAVLQGRYQSFTEAKMDRLRAAGYTKPFTSVEEGVADYIRSYLEAADPYF